MMPNITDLRPGDRVLTPLSTDTITKIDLSEEWGVEMVGGQRWNAKDLAVIRAGDLPFKYSLRQNCAVDGITFYINGLWHFHGHSLKYKVAFLNEEPEARWLTETDILNEVMKIKTRRLNPSIDIETRNFRDTFVTKGNSPTVKKPIAPADYTFNRREKRRVKPFKKVTTTLK